MIRMLLLILTLTVTTAFHLNKYHASSISLMLAPLPHEDDSVNRIIILRSILLPSTFPVSLDYRLDKIYTNSLFSSVICHNILTMKLTHSPAAGGAVGFSALLGQATSIAPSLQELTSGTLVEVANRDHSVFRCRGILSRFFAKGAPDTLFGNVG